MSVSLNNTLSIIKSFGNSNVTLEKRNLVKKYALLEVVSKQKKKPSKLIDSYNLILIKIS